MKKLLMTVCVATLVSGCTASELHNFSNAVQSYKNSPEGRRNLRNMHGIDMDTQMQMEMQDALNDGRMSSYQYQQQKQMQEMQKKLQSIQDCQQFGLCH